MKTERVRVIELDKRMRVEHLMTKKQFEDYCKVAFLNNKDIIRFMAEIVYTEKENYGESVSFEDTIDKQIENALRMSKNLVSC